jgi:hypothetical protein
MAFSSPILVQPLIGPNVPVTVFHPNLSRHSITACRLLPAYVMLGLGGPFPTRFATLKARIRAVGIAI